MTRKHPDFPFYFRCPCCGKDIELDCDILLQDVLATRMHYDLTLTSGGDILEVLGVKAEEKGEQNGINNESAESTEDQEWGKHVD